MYLCLFLLPLYGSFVAGFFGRFLGTRGSAMVTCSCVIVSFVLSVFGFYEVGLSSCPVTLPLFSWMKVDLLDSFWCIYVDSLTAVILVVVTSVSSLVHLYSIGYMSEDPYLSRFMSYLSLFTFLMLSLVLADNYLQLFFGWEGVGLASFLLISFWSSRLQACKAATKAMIMNRIGDVGLALGLCCMFCIFGSLDYNLIFACASDVSNCSFLFCQFEVDVLSTIGILLLVGASGKSAQFGLHTWLPDAMEGPTPVSALIHAATMVTAGVFLLVRTSPILEYSSTALFFISIIGAFTAFFAATTGLVQNDLKRVIAYSTCSQLGYMVFASGLSQYALGVFHLANHAFFKALLFLGAGCIIHALGDEQDLRRMGGLSRVLPFSYSFMLLGSLALVGFPFLSGFYSKDAILETAHAHFSISGSICHWFGTISALFTSYYSFRLLLLGFLGLPNSYRVAYSSCHEAPFPMAFALFPLAFGSLFSGYFGRELFLGQGSAFWSNSIFVLPEHELGFEAECAPVSIKLVPLIFTIFGALISLFIIYLNNQLSYKSMFWGIGRRFYTLFNQRWLFDRVYNEILASPLLLFGHRFSFKVVDKGVLEMLGPHGLVFLLPLLSEQLKFVQSGRVYHYALTSIVGLVVLVVSPSFFNFGWVLLFFSIGSWAFLKISYAHLMFK